MHITLDDETARMAADLRLAFRDSIAESIINYFETPEKINWSSVVTALMMVSADTNNTVELDKKEAINCFNQFMNGLHYKNPENDITH